MADIESRASSIPFENLAYPFGAQKIEGAFNELIDTEVGMEDLLDEQEKAMQDNNPYAHKYLLEVANLYNTSAKDFRYGTALFYMVLGGRVKDMPIPRLTEKFVDGFENMHKDHILKTYGSSSSGSDYVNSQLEREQIARVGYFKMLEPECFDELEEEVLVEETGYNMLSHPVVGGFIFSYFLFRIGLSDPANYTAPPFN